MHIAAEYVAKFYKVRKSLPATAISSNVAVITAIANDFDYKKKCIFFIIKISNKTWNIKKEEIRCFFQLN